MHGVAAAHVVGGSVGADGLGGAGDAGVGDVGSTEVVHGGGVGPVVVDGRARGEHALVGAGHSVADGGVGVGQEALANTEGGISAVLEVGGTEEEASSVRGGGVEVHAARVVADAGRELLEVVDGVEHLQQAVQSVRTEFHLCNHMRACPSMLIEPYRTFSLTVTSGSKFHDNSTRTTQAAQQHSFCQQC